MSILFQKGGKKSIVFAEAPTKKASVFDYQGTNPVALEASLRYNKTLKELGSAISDKDQYNRYVINYMAGYTGENVSEIDEDTYATPTERKSFDFKTKLPDIHAKKAMLSNKIDSLATDLANQDKKFNELPVQDKDYQTQTFITEGNKFRDWYSKQGEDVDVVPLYGIQDTSIVNKVLQDNIKDVAIFGHSGKELGGIPLSWWNKKLAERNPEKCILGSCYGDKLQPELRDIKNLYHTKGRQWLGINPIAKTLEKALFSTDVTHTIDPIEGTHYNISNKQ